jgi:hypothetical protein
MVSFFQPWGQYKAIKFSILLVTWGRLKSFFNLTASTPSVKPSGLISTFAPIGMLDLDSTLALTPSENLALEHLQQCSVCEPPKIFFTSKFSYLLFWQPHP